MPRPKSSRNKKVQKKETLIEAVDSVVGTMDPPAGETAIGLDSPEMTLQPINNELGVPDVESFDTTMLTREELAEESGGWALYKSRYKEDKFQIGKKSIISINGIAQMMHPIIARFHNYIYKCPLAHKNTVKAMDAMTRKGIHGLERIVPSNPIFKVLVNKAK